MRRSEFKKKQQKRKLIIWGSIVAAVIVFFGAAYAFSTRPKEDCCSPDPQQNVTEKDDQVVVEEKQVDSVDVQPIIDQFVSRSSVDYGIEVYDVAAGKVIGSHQPDKQYFTASIYKLYVAYLSLQRMQSGEFTDTPNYLGERSRMGCIAYTIETSDSPCGEKLMGDITQSAMGKELQAFGLKNSPFPGFKTTAHDANLILRKILEQKELNADSTAYLKKAMNTQVYRNGLPKGFSEAQVYDKVGFNEDINFHDVGIVEFANGRTYLVSMFTEGQGSSRPHRELAALLQPELLKVN